METASLTVGAMARAVYWLASRGGGFSAIAGALPGGRVLSRSSPFAPSSMNRAYHHQTVVVAGCVAHMITAVLKPSALINTIRARQTWFF